MEVASVGKSVFLWPQQGCDYGYWGVRDPNFPDLGECILKKANGNFETHDKRDVLGIIEIRVGALLIAGSDLSDVYISGGGERNSR